MAKKTSIHICAAKYGAEKHNRREKEMKHVHPEYSHLNKSWEALGFKSVADEIRKAKERYSAMHHCRKAILGSDGKQLTIPAFDAKTGAPVIDPRTGQQKVVPQWEPDLSKPKKMPKNAEPIREGVAVITESTSMEQMRELGDKIEQRWGIKTIGIWAHLDEGHEHLVTDKDHQQGKYLDSPEGSTVFLWNHHAHYLFDWTDHSTGQCYNLNRHDMSELQDMLANTFKMERGKKSDKKWRDAHTYKAELEKQRAKEVAEYVERKKEQGKQIDAGVKAKEDELSKLQKCIDELLAATNISEESMEAVSFADMPFKVSGSDQTFTAKDLVNDAVRRISKDLNKPIPLLGRDEWQKERNAYAQQVVADLQEQLISVARIHKKKIKEMGKLMYLDAKKKAAQAVRIEQENERLKQRISELDEKAVARERARADKAEQKVKEQAAKANQWKQKAHEAEKRLSGFDTFLRIPGISDMYKQWSLLNGLIDDAVKAFNAWAHSTASIFSRTDEQIIGRGIVAECQLNGLDPCSEQNRQIAASNIANKAEESVGKITQFQWDIAVTRIGQLASEMILSRGGQSVGGSNGNADELTNWDGTKKRGLGR